VSDGAFPALFLRAFEATVGHEGGFGRDPADKGNWTGGQVGKGRLVGTKYGISAAAHPGFDIPNLTLDDARNIYFERYWHAAGCDRLPPVLAVLAFDAAVNNGVENAKRFLQRAADVADDGEIGPITLAAVNAAPPLELAEAFQRERVRFMRKLSTWPRYGGGWAERLAALPLQAVAMATGVAARSCACGSASAGRVAPGDTAGGGGERSGNCCTDFARISACRRRFRLNRHGLGLALFRREG
jgi:lysozyme family protein